MQRWKRALRIYALDDAFEIYTDPRNSPKYAKRGSAQYEFISATYIIRRTP
jgi:hypothetical protein